MYARSNQRFASLPELMTFAAYIQRQRVKERERGREEMHDVAKEVWCGCVICVANWILINFSVYGWRDV